MKALIMGGGMSGLATAINLLDLGVEVELIEADEILGGRASSWKDEDGDMIDNALHVFFPYYVNLLRFFDRMGIADNILWKKSEFAYMLPGGKPAVMRFTDLPAPLHAAAAFLPMLKDYKAIPRWKMLFGGLTLSRALMYSQSTIDGLDDITFSQWAERLAPRGCLKQMEPGVNGLTFTPSSMISAKVMLNWIRKVFASTGTAKVGFANGGLGDIWVGTCLDYIKKKGGKVELKKAVTAIAVKNGKVDSVTVNGRQKRRADLYVSAIGPFAMRKVLPEEAFTYTYFQDLLHFTMAPSLSLQVWFDRSLTDIETTIFSNDCIFNTYADLANVLPHIFKGGTMFEMVLSPADHILGLPDEVIFNTAIGQIRELFPSARDAHVRKYKVVRERQGVYRALPGMERHRPYQRSPYTNLYLTGDYTKTHVSSGGMEAAIWNANRCAEIIAQDKLGKQITLNTEFQPDTGLIPYIRLGLGAALVWAGFRLLRCLRR